jgi:hypothetical protein
MPCQGTILWNWIDFNSVIWNQFVGVCITTGFPRLLLSGELSWGEDEVMRRCQIAPKRLHTLKIGEVGLISKNSNYSAGY